MADQHSSAWTALALPGIPQLGRGRYLAGGLYLVLALATASLAFAVNRHFFLAHVWRFKELELPDTFIRQLYASKQQTIYNFVYMYFILGFVSAIDHWWSRPNT